jgi:hypothetical protein
MINGPSLRPPRRAVDREEPGRTRRPPAPVKLVGWRTLAPGRFADDSGVIAMLVLRWRRARGLSNTVRCASVPGGRHGRLSTCERDLAVDLRRMQTREIADSNAEQTSKRRGAEFPCQSAAGRVLQPQIPLSAGWADRIQDTDFAGIFDDATPHFGSREVFLPAVRETRQARPSPNPAPPRCGSAGRRQTRGLRSGQPLRVEISAVGRYPAIPASAQNP